MNIQQVRSLCAIIDNNLHMSAAAATLGRSQPSVSRQILELEDELGVRLFDRRRNKIIGLTPNGAEVVAIARRLLHELENLRRFKQNADGEQAGSFTLATTHTQARYTLPPVIQRFRNKFPDVKTILHQGSPIQCFEAVATGRADFAICTEIEKIPPEIVFVPCCWLSRCVITPLGHPLVKIRPLTLEAIARFPIITYGEGFTGKKAVDKAFRDHDLHPSVVMSAIDADVSKTYVELGLGVAILARIAFDRKRDGSLRRLEAAHLFEPSRLGVAVRLNTYLRGYMLTFIEMFAPQLRVQEMARAARGEMRNWDQKKLPIL
jgi:LysR family transcriptional regulator, cys regulon transcriptional activator